jgi:hypothetical protein
MPLPTETNPTSSVTYDELVKYGYDCAVAGQHQGVNWILDFLTRQLSQTFNGSDEQEKIVSTLVYATIEEVRELFRLAGAVK